VVVAVLLVVVRPTVVEILTMGMRMPETCSAVFKRQMINLKIFCIWLVVSFECMMVMMHGLANPKYSFNICSSEVRKLL
jgi:hypothetical protein